MNDRELLDLAAKAAGLNIIHMPLSGPSIVDSPNIGILWNPLTDDGDALRLAVRLRLLVDVSLKDQAHVQYPAPSTQYPGSTAYQPLSEDSADDIQAATRRAIVRAAAEIGATQPSKDGGVDEQGRLGSAVDYWRKNALKVDGTIRTSDARATDNKEQ